MAQLGQCLPLPRVILSLLHFLLSDSRRGQRTTINPHGHVVLLLVHRLILRLGKSDHLHLHDAVTLILRTPNNLRRCALAQVHHGQALWRSGTLLAADFVGHDFALHLTGATSDEVNDLR